MKHRSKSTIPKWIVTLLLSLLFVKLLWLVIEIVFLPTIGINHIEEKGKRSLYYRVNLSQERGFVPKKVVKKPLPVSNIKEITLLAIYHAQEMSVVTIVYKGKTKVLKQGEEFNGFVLEEAGKDYAIFSKHGKRYRVDLIKGKHPSHSRSIQRARSVSAYLPHTSTVEGEITDVGDHHKIVDRSLLKHYAKNMDDIYKNIGIVEVRKGRQIQGFKITFVRRNSPFAKLGIQRGDIIKSINGELLNNYNVAFNIYRNIGDIENLTLVIQRGKEEMELDYEIN